MNLGNVQYEKGDLDGAKLAYEKALSIYDKVYALDSNHPEIARTFMNLGNVLYKKGWRYFGAVWARITPPRNSCERTSNPSSDNLLNDHNLPADPARLGDPVEVHPREGIDQAEIRRLGPGE